MDKSIDRELVRSVLGTHRVGIKDLSAADWLEIYDYLLDYHRRLLEPIDTMSLRDVIQSEFVYYTNAKTRISSSWETSGNVGANSRVIIHAGFTENKSAETVTVRLDGEHQIERHVWIRSGQIMLLRGKPHDRDGFERPRFTCVDLEITRGDKGNVTGRHVMQYTPDRVKIGRCLAKSAGFIMLDRAGASLRRTAEEAQKKMARATAAERFFTDVNERIQLS